MPYATEAAFDAAFSENERTQLVTNREGGFDAAASGADGEIHSYLAIRYAVPVDPAPSRLVAVALDIARYRLYDDVVPEAVQARYDAATKWLRDIANGRAVLTADDGTPIHEADDSVTPLAAVAPKRDLTFDAAFRGRYRLGVP